MASIDDWHVSELIETSPDAVCPEVVCIEKEGTGFRVFVPLFVWGRLSDDERRELIAKHWRDYEADAERFAIALKQEADDEAT